MGAELQDGCREGFCWLWFLQGCSACLSHDVLQTLANAITPASPCTLGKYLLWDIKVLKCLITKPSQSEVYREWNFHSAEELISGASLDWNCNCAKHPPTPPPKKKKKLLFFFPTEWNPWRLSGGNQDGLFKKFRAKSKPDKTACLLEAKLGADYQQTLLLLWISSSSGENCPLHHSAKLPIWGIFNILSAVIARWLVMPELVSLTLAWCIYRGCKSAFGSSQHNDL